MDDRDDPRALRDPAGAPSPRPAGALSIGLLVVLAAVGVGVISFFRMRAMATQSNAVVLPRRVTPDLPDPPRPDAASTGGGAPAAGTRP